MIWRCAIFPKQISLIAIEYEKIYFATKFNDNEIHLTHEAKLFLFCPNEVIKRKFSRNFYSSAMSYCITYVISSKQNKKRALIKRMIISKEL